MLDSGYEREADRFVNCGRRFQRFESERTGIRFGIAEHCRSRVCDTCSVGMFYKFRRQVLSIVRELPTSGKKRVGFLTLTFRKAPLTRSYMRSCTKAVRQFVNIFYGKYYHRYRPETAKFVKTKTRQDCGAVAVMEIGPSGNLHFHCLVYGYFHPIKFMSSVWKRITGDSYRIDIRQVSTGTKQSPARATDYILKYIRKPPAFDTVDDFLRYWLLLKGIRRLHTYGVFYNHPAFKQDREPLLCPFTGDKLKYTGAALRGEFLVSYSAVVRALKDGTSAHGPPGAIIEGFAKEKIRQLEQRTGGSSRVNDSDRVLDLETVDYGLVVRSLNYFLDSPVALPVF